MRRGADQGDDPPGPPPRGLFLALKGRKGHEIRSPALGDLGLGPALEVLAGSVAARKGLKVTARSFLRGQIPVTAEIHLYRISVKTADSHRSRLMKKLDIHETAGLVRYAIRRGLVEP